MCDYCEMEKGDSPKKPVIEESISFGMLGEEDLIGYIYTDYEKPVLCVSIGRDKEIHIPIKYCPMCGRKLDGMDSRKD